jgi:asparagine synthetase B (glutamine-hydrolysing)
MAVGMEGRFPLATKMFIQYCMNISSKHKIGIGKDDTKLLPKKAYKGILPNSIITKKKTGWTVPAREWAKQNMDGKLVSNAYKRSQERKDSHNIHGLDIQSKALIPAWMVKDWATKYQLIKE